MHIEAIAIGVFVFVVIYVGGSRALDTLARHRATRDALRRMSVTNRAKRVDYTGPRYSARDREIGE